MNDDENLMDETKHAFLNFMLEAFKTFAPKASRKVMYQDAVNFVNDWVEKNYD